MTGDANELKPAWEAYARDRGVFYYENWSVPEGTQLMHHGDFGDTPNVIIGDLPGGLDDSWLAEFVSADSGRSYTVVIVSARSSVRFAVRVLCHDRDLARKDASNPDADRETVPMEDRDVRVESDAFLRRYDLSTDHDQDQVRAWQLFDPALIEWLTKDAPPEFSFELQDGALCCFVAGSLADPDRLDELCRATATILARVIELGDEPAAGPSAPGSQEGTREGEVDRALAEHPFSKPPRSALAASLHFGAIPLLSGGSRRLGAEAFFRAHTEALGLKRIDPSQFMADHISLAVPGAVTNVAAGTLPGTSQEGYLVGTSNTDMSGGWLVAVADIAETDNGFAFVALPDVKEAEKDGFDVSSNGTTITVWKPDGGPTHRSARELDRFCKTACPLLEKAVAIARR